jgi:hypothetical protein
LNPSFKTSNSGVELYSAVCNCRLEKTDQNLIQISQ